MTKTKRTNKVEVRYREGDEIVAREMEIVADGRPSSITDPLSKIIGRPIEFVELVTVVPILPPALRD